MDKNLGYFLYDFYIAGKNEGIRDMHINMNEAYKDLAKAL